MNTVDTEKISFETKKGVTKKAVKYMIYSQEQAFRHMTQRRSEKEQLLYTVSDNVLFNVWDPCCLSIDQQYREAYLPYLPHIFDLLSTTDDGLDLYDYLVFIEESKFGSLKGDTLTARRASRVVDLLLEHRHSIFGSGKELFNDKSEKTTDYSDNYPA